MQKFSNSLDLQHCSFHPELADNFEGPSYGHRPSSANRTYNPLSQSLTQKKPGLSLPPLPDFDMSTADFSFVITDSQGLIMSKRDKAPGMSVAQLRDLLSTDSYHKHSADDASTPHPHPMHTTQRQSTQAYKSSSSTPPQSLPKSQSHPTLQQTQSRFMDTASFHEPVNPNVFVLVLLRRAGLRAPLILMRCTRSPCTPPRDPNGTILFGL